MQLLLAKTMQWILKQGDPHIGRMVGPKHFERLDETDLVMPWAADNDAFTNFNQERYMDMLVAIASKPRQNLLWITVPDVVGDAEKTLELYLDWAPDVRLMGPLAFVAQDGLKPEWVPWNNMDCLFIGGTTEYKLSPEAAELARMARAKGKLVHMGRVNSIRRLLYAKYVGCHTVDGTGWGAFPDHKMPRWRFFQEILAAAQ